MSENQKSDDNKFGTGAVRSADADHLDFLSMPLIGLIGMARTTFEGGSKYGRFNYMKGMPAHVCVNHAIRHLVMWGMGDRSEPHLSHAMWNCAAAEQSMVLSPELNAPHLPGPGYTLTPEILAHLDEQAPKLAEKRKDKEWLKKLGGWVIGSLAEIQTILGQRRQSKWKRVVNNTIREYIRQKERTIGTPKCKVDFNGPPMVNPNFVTLKNDQADEGATGTEHIVFTESKTDWTFKNGVLHKYGRPATPGEAFAYADRAFREQIAGIDQDGKATTEVKPDQVVHFDNPKDIFGKPIPQSLWIYLKGKTGLRYMEDERGAVNPQPGETWCEFDDGSRLYWQDEESRLQAIKASRPYSHPSGLADNDPRRHTTGIVGNPGPKTGFE